MARTKGSKNKTASTPRKSSTATLEKKRAALQAKIDEIDAEIEARKNAEAESEKKKELLAQLQNKSAEELAAMLGAE
jgi:predicted ribosome quality control (RQC) complex YloA/Tae2 family protein